jgi:bacterial/archaeal transporter family protein
MRIVRMRVSCPHDLPEQNESWISELVFLQNRIERNIFAVMSQLAIWYVEYDPVIDLCPVGAAWQEDKFCVLVDEVLDQPRTSDAVHFNFLVSDPFHELESCFVATWFWYAVVAAVLYGAHQIFTRLAAERIGEGLGGFVVEASAAVSILLYLAFLWLSGTWNQKFSAAGFNYSLLTGVCVGAGTIAFFLLFQRGGPLSAVPAILAGGAAIMAIAGILFFREAPSWQRLFGIMFAIVGLFLLRK